MFEINEIVRDDNWWMYYKNVPWIFNSTFFTFFSQPSHWQLISTFRIQSYIGNKANNISTIFSLVTTITTTWTKE
jgi:hypothetical protein